PLMSNSVSRPIAGSLWVGTLGRSLHLISRPSQTAVLASAATAAAACAAPVRSLLHQIRREGYDDPAPVPRRGATVTREAAPDAAQAARQQPAAAQAQHQGGGTHRSCRLTRC